MAKSLSDWKYRVGDLSRAVSMAFGGPRKRTKTSHLKKRSKNGIFLTETYEEERLPNIGKETRPEVTYQDLIKEVDEMMGGLKVRRDDLAHLRRRINFCEKGIEVQSTNTQNINKAMRDIHSSANSTLKRIKSYSLIARKKTNNSLVP